MFPFDQKDLVFTLMRSTWERAFVKREALGLGVADGRSLEGLVAMALRLACDLGIKERNPSPREN